MAGNASATANNIAAQETLFRLGIMSDLFTATMAIFLTLALYRLFKGVDEGLARLMVILGALMVTIKRRSCTAARPWGRFSLCHRQAAA